MNHSAIYAIYSQVVTIDDSAGAFDKNGNKVRQYVKSGKEIK